MGGPSDAHWNCVTKTEDAKLSALHNGANATPWENAQMDIRSECQVEKRVWSAHVSF
jgi:hypothetical protein